MRKIVLLRGIPGSGKSTFIKEKGLEAFVVSPDNIRMNLSGLVMNEEGKMVIDQSKGKEVWERVFKSIENKMKNGEFIIVDATNLVTRNLSTYKKLSEKYRYRVYMLDFTKEVGYEELLERDENREEYKKVGKKVIDIMYENMLVQNENGLPNWLDVVELSEFEDKVLEVPVQDLSEYRKVNIIGDVHGCNTVLKEYLNGRLKDDEFYIFTGDYFERGIENVEVLNFLLQIYTKKNVVMLEGNHELYLWQYANGENIRCKEFGEVTRVELDNASVDKKDIRRFYRKLRVAFKFKYNSKEVLVTHGGLTTMPKYLSLVSDVQIIRGVGDYSLDVDAKFNENIVNKDFYQVHGHRNIFYKEVVEGNSINLEGKVEAGGFLRVVEFEGNEVKGLEIQNNVFNPKYKKKEITPHTTIEELVEILKENSFINVVEVQDGIKSFNFTRQAFFDGVWNNQTVKARGLHIDVINNRIIARSFEKFFGVDEYDFE